MRFLRQYTSLLSRAIFTLVLGCFLVSCQPLRNTIPYEAKSKHEKEIAALKAEFSQKIAESNAMIRAALQEQLAAKDAQIQAVADSFYGISTTFHTVITPTRAELIMANMGEEGWASINHLTPTYAQMVKINERIARELDESKTSLEDLKKTHDAVVAENAKLSEAEKAAEKRVTEAEKVKAQMQEDYEKRIAAAQDALIEAQDRINAAEKARSDNAAARQAQLAKLSWGAGILAALCLAGALFSPVFKTELGIASGAFAAAAVAIPFVEGWMILAGFGLIIAGVTIWAIRRFHHTNKALTALVNRDHDIAQTNPQVFNDVITPKTAEYATKYAKASDGSVTTVPDKTITATIDSKLIATDRK